MTQIFLILMAWLVEMPLWLSITMTVCLGLSILTKTAIAVGKTIAEDYN